MVDYMDYFCDLIVIFIKAFVFETMLNIFDYFLTEVTDQTSN